MPQFWGMLFHRKRNRFGKKRALFSTVLSRILNGQKTKREPAACKKRAVFGWEKTKNLFQKNRFPSVFFRISSLSFVKPGTFFQPFWFKKKRKSDGWSHHEPNFFCRAFLFSTAQTLLENAEFFSPFSFFGTAREPKRSASTWRQMAVFTCLHVEAFSPFSWYHPNPRLRLG